MKRESYVTVYTSSTKPLEWISVEDRLPEELQIVLWLHDLKLRLNNHNILDSPTIITGYLVDWGNYVILNDLDEYDQDFPLKEFTHWMPLPEPPNEKA